MATFTNPTKDTSIVVNPSLSGVSRTWDQATETWDQQTNTWNDPAVPFIGVTKNVSTVVNPTKN